MKSPLAWTLLVNISVTFEPPYKELRGTDNRSRNRVERRAVSPSKARDFHRKARTTMARDAPRLHRVAHLGTGPRASDSLVSPWHQSLSLCLWRASRSYNAADPRIAQRTLEEKKADDFRRDFRNHRARNAIVPLIPLPLSRREPTRNRVKAKF